MIEKELNAETVCRSTGSGPEVVLRETRSMRTLTKLVSSKYNKCFKKALTVVNPAEKQSGDTLASSRLELSGNWAPGQLPCLCGGVQGRNLWRAPMLLLPKWRSARESTTLGRYSVAGSFPAKKVTATQLCLKGTRKDWSFARMGWLRGNDTLANAYIHKPPDQTLQWWAKWRGQ